MSRTEPMPGEWWCWTEGEPSTFRCRERHHDVREAAPAGVLPSSAWTDSRQELMHLESQLRDAEREGLKALAERDNLRELWAALAAEVNRLGTDLASARADRDRAWTYGRARENELRAQVTAVGDVLNNWQTRYERAEHDNDMAHLYDDVLTALSGGTQ